MNKTTKLLLSLITAALLIYGLSVLEANRFQQGMLYSVLQKSAILAIAAVSMNLLNGFTGLFSLGQAGFMALGAYTTAVLTIPTAKLEGVYYMDGISSGIIACKTFLDGAPGWLQMSYPFLALIAGGLVAAGFAALIGMPILRLKSDYLAIATLGFSEIVRAVIASPELNTVTNGSYGLKSIPKLGSIVTTFIIAAVLPARRAEVRYLPSTTNVGTPLTS
jgi:branched-chain amino acid transport system permease protein